MAATSAPTPLRRNFAPTCYREVQEASVAVFGAPAVDGLGNAGGFKIMVRDVGNLGLDSLQEAADDFAANGNEQPGLVGLYSAFRSRTPQMYVDVDRERCKAMDVPLNEVFLTLQLYLGGYYTNDFNQFGRTWQVNLQGDPGFRLTPDQVRQLKVRNAKGEMVPLGSVAHISPVGGPALVVRYNGITAAAVNGGSLPGVSSGIVIKTIDRVAQNVLPQGMDTQWTELTLLQILAGNTAIIVFALAVVLVFLVLAAQYESLSLPLAVILVVPMCLLCSTIGVALAHMDINIFVQIGFIVLVGLGQQERHFDRRIRQGEIRRRCATARCRRRSLPTAFAPDHHDLNGVYPWRLATCFGRWGRCRNAANAGNRRVLRHARRHAVWHLPHACVLLRGCSTIRSPRSSRLSRELPSLRQVIRTRLAMVQANRIQMQFQSSLVHKPISTSLLHACGTSGLVLAKRPRARRTLC